VTSCFRLLASGQLRSCMLFCSSADSSLCTSSIRALRNLSLVTMMISFGVLLSHHLSDTIRSLSKPIVGTISETSLLGIYVGLSGSGIGSSVVPTIFLTAHLTRCQTLEDSLVSEVPRPWGDHLPEPHHDAIREKHAVRLASVSRVRRETH
jgi:hypothetical protein